MTPTPEVPRGGGVRELSSMNRIMAHTLLTSGDLLCFGKEGADHSELCDLVAYALQAKDEALRMQRDELMATFARAASLRREVGELRAALERIRDAWWNETDVDIGAIASRALSPTRDVGTGDAGDV